MKRTTGITIGLVLAGLLGLADVVSLPFGDGETPPVPVAIASAILGLITLTGVVLAWRGRRGGIVAVIVTRLLSALSAVPAFFVDDVPGPLVGVAAFGVGVTLASIVLVTPALRTRTAATVS